MYVFARAHTHTRAHTARARAHERKREREEEGRREKEESVPGTRDGEEGREKEEQSLFETNQRRQVAKGKLRMESHASPTPLAQIPYQPSFLSLSLRSSPPPPTHTHLPLPFSRPVTETRRQKVLPKMLVGGLLARGRGGAREMQISVGCGQGPSDDKS